jgi:N-acetylglucosaminyldiphosphoundecaprenol N-acetyl-beta-D-mannosaminyltransferase
VEIFQDSELVLGYPVVNRGISGCLDVIDSWLASGAKQKVFVCANPHSLVLAEDDPLFQQAIHAADIVTPDGAGIILASKILGGSIRERVTGSDIFWGMSERLNASGGMSYFFLGSTVETLAEIKSKMALDFPNIRFAGCYSPPYKPEFSEEDSRRMVEVVNAARPDVLWVGMTAPKQEKWIYRHRAELDVKFIGAIGAVFDFYVGKVKRSHPVFQKMGLEWLPRLLQEPRRLFRRNFVSSPLFLFRVFRQRLYRTGG